jgi:hypothetical protein
MLTFFRKHYGHLTFLVTLPIKLAIYFRAMMALAMMANWRLRKYMGLVNRVVSPIYVLKGGSAMKKSCEEILTRKGLSYKKDFVDKNNVCIVYDADTLSYEDIIRLAKENAGCILGTYSSKNHMIITPKEIIK